MRSYANLRGAVLSACAWLRRAARPGNLCSHRFSLPATPIERADNQKRNFQWCRTLLARCNGRPVFLGLTRGAGFGGDTMTSRTLVLASAAVFALGVFVTVGVRDAAAASIVPDATPLPAVLP